MSGGEFTQDEFFFVNEPVGPELPTPKIKQTFLGWEKSLLEKSAHYLSQETSTGQMLDLSDDVVVIPTKNGARRLREKIATILAEEGKGFLPPRFLFPEELLATTLGEETLASEAQQLETWIKCLLEAPLGNYQRLFPVAPLQQDFTWAFGQAQAFLQLQLLIAENAHTATYVSKVLAQEELEGERWLEFAKLENSFFGRLQSQGLLAPGQARRRLVDNTETLPIFANARRIRILGLCDFPPALLPLFEKAALEREIEVIIHAPETEAEFFDEWGRPITELWKTRHLPLPHTHLHPTNNPVTQATLAKDLISAHPRPSNTTAIGLLDTEINAPIRSIFASNELTTYNPSGSPFSRHGISCLLQSLFEIWDGETMTSVRSFLRIPGVAELAGNFEVPNERQPFSPNEIIDAFDKLHDEHLPGTISHTFSILESLNGELKAIVTRTLQWLQHWLKRLQKPERSEEILALLSEVYHAGKFLEDEYLDEAATQLAEVLQEVSELTFPLKKLNDYGRLVSSLLEKRSLSEHSQPNAIELLGWLELPWEDAPHLILVGCNEESLPESITSHSWLPNHARTLLGLRDNAQRYARDLYMLTALQASREANGRLDLLFAHHESSGDPLRPSRLLMARSGEELPPLIEKLFTPLPHQKTTPSRSFAWKLEPPTPDPSCKKLEKLAVTSFRNYLACPFRFYLQRSLAMNSLDLDRRELNPRKYGDLAHNVLEDFAKSSARDSDNEEEISLCLLDLVATRMAATYGSTLTAPLLFQRSSLEQRFRWWASLEARERQAGWRILETEKPLASQEEPFLVNGLVVHGYIDRIEQHPTQGLRILDFKTKAKPSSVAKAHLSFLPRSKEISGYPEWQLWQEKEDKFKIWLDLQIPLYLLALGKRFPEVPMKAGYVQFAATKSELQIELWDQLSENHDLLLSALSCAEGITEAIKKREFWPPRQEVQYDDYDSILLSQPEETVNPYNLQSVTAET